MRLQQICTWGWDQGGVVLGETRCEELAVSPWPYGWLCEQHQMEVRLRLVLLPLQLAQED
jgi:hypothetical protein